MLLDLLELGVKQWNSWRLRHQQEHIDLRGAQLDRRDLTGVDLHNANLGGALFVGTRLHHAKLDGARFYDTDLSGASLDGASVRDAILGASSLIDTRLVDVNARGSQFQQCDLSGARLEGSSFWSAQFLECRFAATSFEGASLGYTRFYASDLSVAIDLGLTEHRAPSLLDLETLRMSRGQLCSEFLKGCGLSNFEVAITPLWNPDLTESEVTDIVYDIDRCRGRKPIQTHAVFLSYSHHDTAFVDALQAQLDEADVRFWRDVQDLASGRLEKQIDRAIRLNPIVILVLSSHSADSDWVEWEASRARQLEKELRRDVLCPIALDGSWRNNSWSTPLRAQIAKYNILDFSGWQDPETLDTLTWRLLKGLRLFYRGS